MNAVTQDESAALAVGAAPAPPQLGVMHRYITPVGSRVTCNPPPTNTDQDWLVFLTQDAYDAFAQAMLKDGWQVGGSLIPNDDNYLPESARFNSFTRGVDNVIATASEEFHRRFLAASAIAKRLNLLNKADRIALFQAVLYGAHMDPGFAPASSQPEPSPF